MFCGGYIIDMLTWLTSELEHPKAGGGFEDRALKWSVSVIYTLTSPTQNHIMQPWAVGWQNGVQEFNNSWRQSCHYMPTIFRQLGIPSLSFLSSRPRSGSKTVLFRWSCVRLGTDRFMWCIHTHAHNLEAKCTKQLPWEYPVRGSCVRLGTDRFMWCIHMHAHNLGAECTKQLP